MQYIAIGYRSCDKIDLEKLEYEAGNHDLKVVPCDNDQIDPEVRNGVVSFIKAFDLQPLQLIRLSTEKQDQTSGGVDQNLFEYSMGQAEPNLIKFLHSSKDILPLKYYLIFAFEWNKNQPVRYREFCLDELSEFLFKNGSWYFRLYDFLHNSFTSELDFPLIVEIENTSHD